MMATRGFALSLFFILICSGCQEPRVCGSGTLLVENECVPFCSDGESWSDGQCVRPCAEGTVFNEDNGLCEPEFRCGEGTHLDGFECVPDSVVECGQGTVYDPISERCVPECVEGTHRDETTGACMPDSAVCITGQVWDSDSEECVDVAGYCGEGTTWVASEQRCVPNDLLLVADYTEESAENDPSYGGEAESIVLPDFGTKIVIGGEISPAEDKDDDGDLDADFDYFAFEISGPTLLRIQADGVGGASSGFLVTGMDSLAHFQRFGIGTTSDGATRDVFLPEAGRYALVASDAMNFITPETGPFFGGDGLRYFITLENIPIPIAQEIVIEEGETSSTVENAWPHECPERGSMLTFYSFSLERGSELPSSFFAFHLSSEDTSVVPITVAIDADDSFLFESHGQPTRRAFNETTEVIVVADYQYWFGSEDVSHSFTVTELPLESIDEPLGVTRIRQSPLSSDDVLMPSTYFVFHAEQGQVITFRATTTTGETKFEAFDRTFETSFGWFGGQTGSPQNEGNVRFYCPETDIYIVEVIDLAGHNPVDPPESLPARNFDITGEVRRQYPIDTGEIMTSWSTESPIFLTADDREQFFLVETKDKGSYFFEVFTEETFSASGAFYDITDPGPLHPAMLFGNSLYRRFPNGQNWLIGISNADLSFGTFEFEISTVDILGLGSLSEAEPIELEDVVLSHERTMTLVKFDPESPGQVTFNITPDGDLDIIVTTLNEYLEPLLSTDEAGAAEPEASVFVTDDGPPRFISIALSDNSLAPEHSSVNISLSLDPYPTEVEPNDASEDAMPIAPSILAGNLTLSDQDWFSFSVVSPIRIVAETFNVGTDGHADTSIGLFDVDGETLLAEDDDSGDGSLSILSYPIIDEGTYYLRLRTGSSDISGFYFLDFSHEDY